MKYWAPCKLHTTTQGFALRTTDPNPDGFFNACNDALSMLYSRPSGRLLIDTLMRKRNAAPNRFLTIQHAIGGDAGNSCQARTGFGDSDGNRTLLASAFGSGAMVQAASLIKLALNRGGKQRKWDWFANELNSVPRLRIQGVPSSTPGNYGVLPSDIDRWMSGDRPLLSGFQSEDDRADIKNAIQIVIHRLGQHFSGSGAHNSVCWNPGKSLSKLTTGRTVYRTPAIGLAHELVHAYHNALGTQLAWSEDATHETGPLFEFLCVGIGPFKGENPTENEIRDEHHIGLRPAY